MGILDYLENNWQSLLGNDAMASTMNSPMPGPPPPPGPALPQGGEYAPGSTLGTNMLAPGNPTGAPPMPPPTPQSNFRMAQGGMPTNAQGVDPNAPFPNGATPIPQVSGSPDVPLPTPRPQPPGTPPAPGYGVATAAAPGAPLDIRPDPNSQQMLPPTSTPPTMPPQSAMNGGPFGSTTGSLATSLGLTPTGIKTTMAGIGNGLAAVGNMRPGTPAAQAFAAGAGNALKGRDAEENQTFAQSSTAFRDMMLAKQQNDTEGYRQAQAKYLMARATSIANGTGPNGSGVMNSPEQKSLRIENYVNQQQRSMQSMLQKQWSMNNASPEKQADDLANMQKELQAYRNRLYKTAGIDPKEADDLVNRGTDKKNPFDTKGMTLDHFNQSVPMGAWFKDQNGVVRQRTVPPGESKPHNPTTPRLLALAAII